MNNEKEELNKLFNKYTKVYYDQHNRPHLVLNKEDFLSAARIIIEKTIEANKDPFPTYGRYGGIGG